MSGTKSKTESTSDSSASTVSTNVNRDTTLDTTSNTAGDVTTEQKTSQSKAQQSIVQPTIVLFIILTTLTGLAYPALVTGLAQVFFKEQAEGSLIYRHVGDKDLAVGSKLLGQNFSNPAYFWSRPSATNPAYNAAASSGSNMGPTNQEFLASVKGRVEAAKASNPDYDKSKKIPVDLVTASGSGLDPDLSPAAALFQVERVAKARGLSPEAVKELVNKLSQPKQPGFLDEPHVNVLELNLALDNLQK